MGIRRLQYDVFITQLLNLFCWWLGKYFLPYKWVLNSHQSFSRSMFLVILCTYCSALKKNISDKIFTNSTEQKLHLLVLLSPPISHLACTVKTWLPEALPAVTPLLFQAPQRSFSPKPTPRKKDHNSLHTRFKPELLHSATKQP